MIVVTLAIFVVTVISMAVLIRRWRQRQKGNKLSDTERMCIFAAMSQRLDDCLAGREVEPLDEMIDRVLATCRGVEVHQ